MSEQKAKREEKKSALGPRKRRENLFIIAEVFVMFISQVGREPATIYIRADGSIEGTTHVVTVDARAHLY